jgi:hypothetical protein
MRFVSISTGTVLILSLGFTPAFAGQKGNAGKSGPKTTTTKAPGPSRTSHGPSAKAATTPSATATTTKTVKADTKSAKAETKAAHSNKPKKTTTTATDTANTPSLSTSTTTATTVDFTAAPNGEKLSKNSALRSKLERRLTALGYGGTVYEAAYGFKNLGQFVAATNVSQNLGLSFEQLKTQMTGLSIDNEGHVLHANRGSDGTITMVDAKDVTNVAPTKSLGQAIKTLNSSVDAATAANTATAQAETEMATTSVSR